MFFVNFERFLLLEQRIGRMQDAMDAVPMAVAMTIGPRIRDIAIHKLGHYQSAVAGPMGIYPGWAELKDSTKERRLSAGHTPNDPLLETGLGAISIQSSPPMKVEEGVEFVIGYVADVDSSKYMPYHEIGLPTSGEPDRMPPRPVLGPAAIEVMEEVGGVVGQICFSHFNMLTGGGGSGLWESLGQGQFGVSSEVID
jgi:hypothetical protein